MSDVADRSHLSIGEVLSLLQDEFPDITISKIRFLESQGLLDPERTPSGYRKFYEPDIDRLRWILAQQRENFLPLKVIKDRLEESTAAGLVVPPDEPSDGTASSGDSTGAPEPDAPSRRSMAKRAPTLAEEVAGWRPRPEAASSRSRSASNRLDSGPTGISLTRFELCEASGLTPDDLADLERFGLVAPHAVGADTYYDGNALVVGRTAAVFLQFGIEARHLRMYKVAAEREAGFFEQVTMPLVKQRNPEARRQATDTLAQLAELGEALHAALLRVALSDHGPHGPHASH